MQYKIYMIFLLVVAVGCAQTIDPDNTDNEQSIPTGLHAIVLGVAQDAGYPQAGCEKSCCQKYYNGEIEKQLVSCIAVIDPSTRQYWIFDATPDFPEQLRILESKYNGYKLSGIFLTHAHIGHYTGLIHLGREVMGASQVPIYAMPQMANFLETNGPWEQLLTLKNIKLMPLSNNIDIELANGLIVTPTQVPHRDEYSETVGYSIKGTKRLIFIPDIDKWGKWDKDILEEVKASDYALLDGSFYENGEIPGRDMSLIPHPFIQESMGMFDNLSDIDKGKIHFIHFNHTNPVIDGESQATKDVKAKGLEIAKSLQVFEL